MKKIVLSAAVAMAVNLYAGVHTETKLASKHEVLSDTQVADARSAALEYADEVSIVRFSFTVYKDQKKHDPEVWRQAVGMLSEYIARLMAIDERGTKEKDDSNYVEEVTFAFKKLLSELIDIKKNEKEDSGINGEFNVTFGDGKQKTKGCCGGRCMCAERYAGNCPCVSSDDAHQVVMVDVQEGVRQSDSEESDSDDQGSKIN